MSVTVGIGEAAAAALPAVARRRRLELSTTPGRLWLLLAGLVLLSLAWGALAAFTAGQYASAASSVVAAREPLSLEAQQIYIHLSDANDTAVTAFLAGGLEPVQARQRYLTDINAAGTGIEDATVRGAGELGQARADLTTLAAQLPVYTGLIETARADNRLALPLGASYLREASDLMRLTLLPAAASLYDAENASLSATSAQATGLPLIAVTVIAGLAAGGVLYQASRWLSRRTNRVLNVGLVAAGVAVALSVAWLAIAYAGGRSDLLAAQAKGSTPVAALASVAIAAQQAHADESLTLIDNAGDDTYQTRFLTQQRLLGPGQGTLLTAASAVSQGSPGAAAMASAVADAQNWFTAHAAVRAADNGGNHPAAVQSVLNPQSGAGFAFTHLSTDLAAATGADQAAFNDRAQAGASVFTGLEAGVIVAALLMAAGCAWGLSRRLAEYR